MKKCSLLLSSLLVSLAILTACNHSNSKDDGKHNQEDEILKDMVTIQEAKAIIEKNAGNENFVLLDVRTNTEFKEGYLVGHLPEVDDDETDLFKKQRGVLQHDFYNTDFESWLSKLDKAKRYLVYCRTQVRSKAAFDKLKALGFKKIQYMHGGYTAWATAGAEYKVYHPPYKKALDVQIVGDKTKTKSTIKFDFISTNLDGDPARRAKLSLKVIPYSGGTAIGEKEEQTGNDGTCSWSFDATSKPAGKYKLVCEVTHKDAEGNNYEPVEAHYYFEIASTDEPVSGSADEITTDDKVIKPELAKKFYNKNVYGYKAYNNARQVVTIGEKVDQTKPTLMLFISTTCPGCMTKAQELVKYKWDNINVVPILTSVNTNDGKEIEKGITDTENALKNTYNLNDLVPIALYDVKDDIWFARFMFTATPQFVLINKEGQIKDIIYGGAEGVTMETILKKMATKFSLPVFELK